MKTIQLKHIVLALGLLVSATGVSGQKVITNHPSAKGYPVIDLSELSPLGCLLTTTEAVARRTQINAQTPSNTEFLKIGFDTSGATGTWNAEMSASYQVMRADLGDPTDWASAYEACKAYSGEEGKAGEWRLPTQRELMIVWGLCPQLNGKGGFKGFAIQKYWCSMEGYNKTYSWLVNFWNGYAGQYPKSSTMYVRCIRDLM